MKNESFSSRKPIYIFCSNHFDPIWRRGFKKPFFYKGEKYVGDDKIQEACIGDWIKMSEGTDSKFEVECSLVLRTYLEKHPEQLEYVKQLAKEGRMELLASGEVIADTNMPSGETLVRNLAYGLLWAEETLRIPSTTGCLNDAFGSSAQLPQIFKGCDIDWITGFSYKYPVGEYWKGLDGTIIKIHTGSQGFSKGLGYGTYYRPCPNCKGEGCEKCDNRGFDQSYRMGGEPNPDGIDFDKSPYGLIYVGGEETMAPMNLPQMVEEANRKQNEYEYKFILQKDLARLYYKDDIQNAENADLRRISPDIEGNPVQTGCYVSRIKVKQNVRRLENLIASIEKLASIAYINGSEYPYSELTDSWKKAAFASFHDCITGTHVDVGYEELMEAFGESDKDLKKALAVASDSFVSDSDKTITVFNPHGYEVTDYVKSFCNLNCDISLTDESGNPVPVFYGPEKDGFREIEFKAENVPAIGTRRFRITQPSGEQKNNVLTLETSNVIENEFYRVTTDQHGVTSIYDKQLKKELINRNLGYANELILEHDVGDPWSTREAHRPRFRLGKQNDLLEIKKYATHSEIIYKGKFKGNEKILNDPTDYRVLVLAWEQKVILRNGVRKVDFETHIDWDCFDRRIRISFPTYMNDDNGYYAIPYGTLKRNRYDRANMQGISNPDGDWPAVEWFSTAKDKDVNIALMNRGTPSSRIEKGEMFISVLRSPSFPSCLLWPKVYNAPVYDGMRDQGKHVFEYSLCSFYDKWQDSDVVKEAYNYNRPLVAINGSIRDGYRNITIKSLGTEIAAIKKAEKDNAIIVRLNEYRGREENIELNVPEGIASAWETNLLEKNKEQLVIKDGKININMTPFKIKTIKLDF